MTIYKLCAEKCNLLDNFDMNIAWPLNLPQACARNFHLYVGIIYLATHSHNISTINLPSWTMSFVHFALHQT